MNREKLLEHAERIEGNAGIIRRFLHDPTVTPAEAVIEVLGRVQIIEARVAEIRKELSGESGRPESNLHVLGSRPSGGDAA